MAKNIIATATATATTDAVAVAAAAATLSLVHTCRQKFYYYLNLMGWHRGAAADRGKGLAGGAQQPQHWPN